MSISGVSNFVSKISKNSSQIDARNNVQRVPKQTEEGSNYVPGTVPVKGIGVAYIHDISQNGLFATACYSDYSSVEEPIINVIYKSNEALIYHEVKVKDIDTSNATELEMFALCSYADDQGLGDKSTFGTFNTLKGFRMMAVHNGYIGDTDIHNQTRKDFLEQRIDWDRVANKVTKLVKDCKDYNQYEKGLCILNMMSKVCGSKQNNEETNEINNEINALGEAFKKRNFVYSHVENMTQSIENSNQNKETVSNIREDMKISSYLESIKGNIAFQRLYRDNPELK